MANPRGYQEFYVNQSDVPKNMGLNKPILYKTPERIYGYDDMFDMSTFNIKGINYQNVQKEILTHNLVFCWKIISNLKRELASEKVKNEILTKRMIDYNLDPSLEPEEMKEYEYNLSAILSKELKKLTESGNLSLKQEITERVRTELSKVNMEMADSYKYNIIRINNALKYNDILLNELMSGKNKDINSKDRAKLIMDIQKVNRDNMDKLKEICKESGVNLKDITPTGTEGLELTPQLDTNNTSKDKINLAGFLK